MATINEIKAKIQLMRNFAEQAKKIGDEICDMFDDVSDDIFDMLNSIQSCETTVEEAMEELRRCERLNRLEDGEELYTPEVFFGDLNSVFIKKPCNGGYLVAHVGESDNKSSQAGVEWRGNTEKTDYPIDLCLTEVVSGELAETYKLPADNKDVFVYVYDDAFNEFYTSKNIIAYNDICEAFDVKFAEDVKCVRATNIKWDTHEVDCRDLINPLPTTVIVPDDILVVKEKEAISETVSEWLSNEYGFCHDGFELVFLTEKELIAEESKLKMAICDAGVDAVEEFLGHFLDSDEIDIWDEMDDAICQMPDEEYFKYLEKFNVIYGEKKPESKPEIKKTPKKSTKASVTMQWLDENGRVEECFTVKAAMSKDELKALCESCMVICSCRGDINDDDPESIKDVVPANVLEYLDKIGKKVRWSDLEENGFYEDLEAIFDALGFFYENTAPAKGCDITEQW